MKAEIIHFNSLTKSDLYGILALRIAVFVIEQNCPYQDLDGKDKNAFHVIVKDTSKDLIVGTARILPAGISYKEVSIGRVASHPDYRTHKVGHLLMKSSMEFIAQEMQNPDIRISAQSYLCKFYAQYGFVSTGKEYLEDDIPHTEMLYKAQNKFESLK
jgi:ElaA protein